MGMFFIAIIGFCLNDVCQEMRSEPIQGYENCRVFLAVGVSNVDRLLIRGMENGDSLVSIAAACVEVKDENPAYK